MGGNSVERYKHNREWDGRKEGGQRAGMCEHSGWRSDVIFRSAQTKCGGKFEWQIAKHNDQLKAQQPVSASTRRQEDPQSLLGRFPGML